MNLLPRILIAFLLLLSPCWGQEQKATDVIQSTLIEAPDSVAAGRLIAIKLPPDLPFTVEPAPQNKLSFVDEETGKRAYLILEAQPPGYTITIDYAVVHPTAEQIKSAPWDNREKFALWLYENSADEIYKDEHFVKVGDGPEPGPDPPGPEPEPEPEPDEPAPIPEAGFRVLIIYEKDNDLPQLQRAILAGKDVREYLEQTCIKEESGTAGYRIYDQHVNLESDLGVWKKAFQRRPESLPWVIISNGKTGYEGKLPASPSEFIELCKKYEVK